MKVGSNKRKEFMINENKVDKAHRLLKLEIDLLSERLEEIISCSSDGYGGDGFFHSIIGDNDLTPLPPLIKKTGNEEGYLATNLGTNDEVLFTNNDGLKIHGFVSKVEEHWLEVIEIDQFDNPTGKRYRLDPHCLPPFFKKVYDYGIN